MTGPRARLTDFPCKFPRNRENAGGDRFAPDCPHRHSTLPCFYPRNRLRRCGCRAKSLKMQASVVDVNTLRTAEVAAMFRLFDAYYEHVSFDAFRRDLEGKQRAILLRCDEEIVGFTTLAVYRAEDGGRPLRIVFSGDTIVRRDLWGSPVLTAAWIREIGRIAGAEPAVPLYWLLIVKGHRTYRLLPAFGLSFVPHWAGEDAELARLRDRLAAQLFGSSYDSAAGVLRFGEPRGNLRAEWAAASERERRRKDVTFFLDRNPGYATGDELVCLCPLTPGNMRPYARRLFAEGHGG